MKFIKLHQCGRAFLVNLSNVSEVCPASDNKSCLFYNLLAGDQVESIKVDESLDEILEIIKQVGA